MSMNRRSRSHSRPRSHGSGRSRRMVRRKSVGRPRKTRY